MQTYGPQIMELRKVYASANRNRNHRFGLSFEWSRSKSDENSLKMNKTINGFLINVDSVSNCKTSEGVVSISIAFKHLNEIILI